uniref:DUF4781 domain-containing protein n=1 Tax=Panagrolaimus davidi TaxID=227884 RepID=A0A914QJS0_9BILA
MASSDDPTNVPQLPSNDTLTWSWKGSDEWITRATISQNQLYATNAGRMYEASQNYDHIETKILISAFGNPTSTNRSMSTRLNHSYTRPQRKIAIKIRKKMQKHARTESVKLNAVYVMAFLKEKQETMVPVFYFETSGNSCKYIDLQARIYNNWKHFLETNVIDPALCCYPINGHYAQTQTTNTPSFDENVQVQLKVYESPSCSILKTAGRWAQTALTYGTYILMAASMVATVSGAQCIARFSKLNSFCNKMKLIKPYINQAQKFTQYANAATAIASSILNIHDKMTHDQEEILADVTLIVSSVLSILSDPINRAIIKGGLGGKDLANAKFSDLSSISRIFLQLFCFARCATSIISVVTIISTMLLKDQCTGVDYFNLASSLFTCYGTVTSPLTAKKIFEQVQNEYKMEEFNAIKKQIEAEKAKNIKGPGIAEAAAATGAAIVVAATGNKPSQNDANSSDSKPSENQPNESGQCTNDKTSCNNTDSQKTAAESGGGDDPNNPIIPKREHQVEGTETYKNNPKTNKAGLRGEPPITEAEKEALIKRRDELAKKIVVS